jgi:hypothetical protein
MKMSRFGTAALLILATLIPLPANAQTYLVDTGPGATTSTGASSLFAKGSTTCSPQPACGQAFQFLAAQFTLTRATSIDQIELWVVPFSFGGSMSVRIREDVLGLPGPDGPPLFSAGSIYSKTYSVPNVFGPAQWVTFPQYEAVLAAGTYWVVFEPVEGSDLNYSVSGGVANPLQKYAFFANDNNRWIALSPNPFSDAKLGVRIRGTELPGLAFGTMTRTLLRGTTFGYQYDEDFIRSGSRDFARVGVQGPALTSSYIMVIPGGYVHGRGKITERGPSVGAYSVTDGGCLDFNCSASSIGAGRGVAYQTLTYMSDVPVTRRINALLEGSFSRAGKHAYAGVHVFKTTPFSDTILASGVSPEEYLLRRDDLADIADGTNLSLTTLFPPTALLSTTSQIVNGPLDEVSHIPMSTDLITLDPGESITVVFDIAVYAPPGGAVNFGDTLKAAPTFITDAVGNPVYDLVVVGPLAGPTPSAGAVTLSPASASVAIGSPGSVLATVKTGAGVAIPDVVVKFTVASGPNAGLTLDVPTDSNGEATFAYISSLLGTDSIVASVGAVQSTAATIAWTVGALDHIQISPASATIAAGASQAYTAQAFDAFGNSRGSVTGATTFSISPAGSCTGASCGAAAAGEYEVTGSHAGKTSTAALTVKGAPSGFAFTGFFAPVDNAPVLNVVKAGSAVPMKFSLGGNQGLNVLAAGFPVSQPTVCDPGAPLDAITQTATAGSSSLSYDAATGQYTYVWKTDKSWANTCRQFTLRLSDGSDHVATFRFGK